MKSVVEKAFEKLKNGENAQIKTNGFLTRLNIEQILMEEYVRDVKSCEDILCSVYGYDISKNGGNYDVSERGRYPITIGPEGLKKLTLNKLKGSMNV